MNSEHTTILSVTSGIFLNLLLCLIISCESSVDQTNRDQKSGPVEIGDYPRRGQGQVAQKPDPVILNPPEEIIKESIVKHQSTLKTDSLIKSQQSIEHSLKQDKNISKQVVKNVTKASKIVFEQPVFNFDTITEGDIIDHVFTFSNKGNKELNLLKVVPGCGCTLPTYPFVGIAPGDQNEINVRYNSVSKQGPQQTVITVYSDDPAQREYELVLEGFVKKQE